MSTVSSDEFRAVMANYPTGVVVVAGLTEEDMPVGLAVNSFASLSLSPPTVVFCAATTSRSWPRIRTSGRFSVSILSAAAERTCGIFASRHEDKFSQVRWHRGPGGLPVLDDSLATLECVTSSVHPEGDHEIVVGNIVTLKHHEQEHPLLYFQGSYARVADTA